MTEGELRAEFDSINGLLRKDANNAGLYNLRSKLYQALADYQAAMADIDRALRLMPGEAEYYFRKGQLFILVKDIRQAENALTTCAKLDPEKSDCRLTLAELYFYSRRYREAMDRVNEVLRIDMHNADAYFLKGLVHLSSSDTALARSSFQTAVEQNPDFYEAYFELGLLFGASLNPLAISYYDNAIRIAPERVEAYYNKGLICQETGEYNEALKTYIALLRVDPTYRDAHFNMGYINMYHLKQYNQGAIHFTDAIRVSPDFYQAYYNRGYCYELMGDVKRALIDYENALKLKPDYTLAAEGKERVTNF